MEQQKEKKRNALFSFTASRAIHCTNEKIRMIFKHARIETDNESERAF